MFLWQLETDINPELRISPDLRAVLEEPDVLQGWRVVNSGTYLVYSQVVVRGRGHSAISMLPNDCSHRTYLERGNRITEMAVSYVTQDKHGVSRHPHSRLSSRFPHDTAGHSRVMYLRPNDVITIGTLTDCTDLYTYEHSEKAAYFDIVRLN